MTRLGDCLENLFELRNAQFTKEQICSLGIQLINILERLHNAGYVYNDLKLDNILLDYGVNMEQLVNTDQDIFDSLNINIIDFGYVTPYLKNDSKMHIDKTRVNVFRGNLLFASIH